VIGAFRFAWDGYYTYAYPHDDYLPQNDSFSDSRNGWGLLTVDALDTAVIMEQTDIVNIMLSHIATIDFTKNNAQPPNPEWTSLFETNIRYIGGMLSGYDLLKGPFAHLDVPEENVDALLTQAKSLADTLKFAFNTPTGVPVNAIYLDNQTFTPNNLMLDGSYWADLAEFGTLQLEWSVGSARHAVDKHLLTLHEGNTCLT
jgi:mannosyl-oligosaccharide alpha-1,2-mannosidase